ncbi:MAG TPA: DUF1365 domain-containing protein [Rhodanobacteraceae bacterium]
MRASAIYEGDVVHRRHTPRAHAFRYRMAQLYVDLDEVDAILARRWLWSRERRNLAEFRRADFIEPHALSIADAVRARIAEATGEHATGPIRLLAHWRYGGYIFNPVAFYYVFAPDGETLTHVVAEITNTPWRERHAYVLAVDRAERAGRVWRWSFDKTFHVSPFLPLDCRYAWTFGAPGDDLLVHMDVERDNGKAFDATLNLKRRPLTSAALARVLWRYPLMTAQVSAAIYWQALKLWLRGTPVFAHPSTASPLPSKGPP